MKILLSVLAVLLFQMQGQAEVLTCEGEDKFGNKSFLELGCEINKPISLTFNEVIVAALNRKDKAGDGLDLDEKKTTIPLADFHHCTLKETPETAKYSIINYGAGAGSGYSVTLSNYGEGVILIYTREYDKKMRNYVFKKGECRFDRYDQKE